MINNEAHRAAILFAETERASNSRNWRGKLPNDPEARRRLAELEYLCIATETTIDELLREMKEGLDDEADEDDEQSKAERPKTIKEIREELNECRFNLQSNRGQYKDAFSKRKQAGKHTIEFDNLDAKVKRLELEGKRLRNEKKGLQTQREDHERIRVKDPRTVQAFLHGENNKPGKLKGLRDYFLRQLTTGDEWLRPYIDSFFQAVDLRWAREGEPKDSAE